MNNFCLIPVIALLVFLFIKDNHAADSITTAGDNNFQPVHDLYVDQTITDKGQSNEVADDATGVTDAARLNRINNQ
ncbi:MAG TPA: hypothetical protein PLM53_07340 [Spirochaetota bacterium]|mgnify:FL=1|nr:hypothetical protein [Spirochaetota bacterium]HPL19136.1 hypothetical protein [Spirochaetota bacterium]HQF07840.1 hypothetical protein [Spirochaetota bacterium]HQH96893.1 hypothetical protein [Spirochaetota bacterium]HQJ72752.1 hypothetical protein [Spirochaetota bacterium]